MVYCISKFYREDHISSPHSLVEPVIASVSQNTLNYAVVSMTVFVAVVSVCLCEFRMTAR